MKVRMPEIIYEDEALLVCRKAPGVPVQSSRAGQQDMVSLLKNARAKKGETPYIGIVHRLDQPVEGLMVFAKTKRAAASLSEQIRNRQIDKQYLALVCGVPEPSEGELTDYLLRDGASNLSRVVPEGTPGAKQARLSYRVEQSYPETAEHPVYARVRIQLHTGRHHQIRVQLAHAGYPLKADVKYGTAAPGAGFCPIALCSCQLCFTHPVTGKRLEFQTEPTGAGFQV